MAYTIEVYEGFVKVDVFDMPTLKSAQDTVDMINEDDTRMLARIANAPGKKVIDLHTQRIVAEYRADQQRQALSYADRLNKQYGAHRYVVKGVL